jgi:4-hydroxybenzoate polyprenyltransferase
VLKTVRNLLEMIRFSHTLFALPFALLAAVMAWEQSYRDIVISNKIGWIFDNRDLEGYPGLVLTPPENYGAPSRLAWFPFRQLIAILICMTAARSFAMSMNRLADRHLDAANPRTAGRHLPQGILSVKQVAVFAVACAVMFVATTSWFLPNWLPLALSTPVLAFLAGYSYTKRFTALAHFWLGTALALSPVAAWLAIRGQIVIHSPSDLLPSLVLGGAVLAWVAGFDMIYACQDYDADIKAELHSVPLWLGVRGALRLAALCHLVTIVLLACLPLVYPLFGWAYWIAVAAVAGLLVYEHLLVRPDDLSRVNAAFFNVNAVISLGLFAVGSLDLWHGTSVILHRN